MEYHKWTDEERAIVREYVSQVDRPLSVDNLKVISSRMRISVNAVRGAVNRVLSDIRKERG
jgi:hypothetical protein